MKSECCETIKHCTVPVIETETAGKPFKDDIAIENQLCLSKQTLFITAASSNKFSEKRVSKLGDSGATDTDTNLKERSVGGEKVG